MDPYTLFTLPPNWRALPDHLLQAQLETILALANGIDINQPGVDGHPSGLEVAESLADAKDSVEAELGERGSTRAEEEDRRAAAMARLQPSAAPAPAPEMAATGGEELAVTTPDAPEAPEAPEAPAEAPAEAPVETPEAVQAPEAALADTPAAPVPNVTVREGLQRMSARRHPSERPSVAAGSQGFMRAIDQIGVNGHQTGQEFNDWSDLADYFSNYITRNRSNLGGERQQIPIATTDWAYDERVGGSDVEANMAIFSGAQNSYTDAQETLVAAGGPCAPLMPTYEFFECFSPQRPVEAGMPVVGAVRGGIRYLNPVPMNAESAAAITSFTAAQSKLKPGDVGYLDKNCTRVTCPTETEVTVGPVSWCVTFDNLNYRVFPEQVANMLRRVQAEFSKAKEIRYLNRLDSLAGAAVNVATAQANPFGAARSMFRDLVVAGHNYRKRNNMNRDALLDVWLPDVVEDILAIDMVNDFEMGGMGSIIGGPTGNLAEALVRRARLNVNWYYYDGTNAGFPSVFHGQAKNTWNPLPKTFRSYMYAPGSVVRLDGGQLDLGVVRDTVTAARNDLELFAEQWIEVAHVGCEIVALDHTACYSGVGPAAVAAPACP